MEGGGKRAATAFVFAETTFVFSPWTHSFVPLYCGFGGPVGGCMFLGGFFQSAVSATIMIGVVGGDSEKPQGE